MNCEEIHDLLHGYVDGELDLVRSLEIERHLQQCAACSGAVQRHLALRTALNGAALYQRPPAQLGERIRSSLRQANGRRPTLLSRSRRPLALAASLAVVALVAWGVLRLLSPAAAEDRLVQEVVADHIRSLLPGHLLNVESSDQHTVKPWFQGRVDFSPPVKDLTDQGFPLLGGRLEYLDNRNVAALVYKRHQHIINLFIWPAPADGDGVTRVMTRQTYHLIHWTKAGLTYWVVSDLNEMELRDFVRLIQQ